MDERVEIVAKALMDAYPSSLSRVTKVAIRRGAREILGALDAYEREQPSQEVRDYSDWQGWEIAYAEEDVRTVEWMFRRHQHRL